MTNKFPAPRNEPPGQTFDRPSTPEPTTPSAEGHPRRAPPAAAPATQQTALETGNQQRGGTRLADRDSEPAKAMSVQGPASVPPGQNVPPTAQPADPDKTGFFTHDNEKDPSA